jgi:hypothetical protein
MKIENTFFIEKGESRFPLRACVCACACVIFQARHPLQMSLLSSALDGTGAIVVISPCLIFPFSYLTASPKLSSK